MEPPCPAVYCDSLTALHLLFSTRNKLFQPESFEAEITGRIQFSGQVRPNELPNTSHRPSPSDGERGNRRPLVRAVGGAIRPTLRCLPLRSQRRHRTPSPPRRGRGPG